MHLDKKLVTQLSIVGSFAVAVGLLGPALANGLTARYLLIEWAAYSIAAVGFYWVFGLAGRFAFCQTFMMLLGGYTSAWVIRELGAESFVLGVLAGMVAAGLVALVLGYIVRKAAELYFAIATLALMELGNIVFVRATAFAGANGTVTGIPIPEIGGLVFDSSYSTFVLVFVVLVVLLVFGTLLERSPVRRNVIATRENRLVARSQGLATYKIEIGFFVLGSAAGGLSGALIGSWNGSVGASSFGIELAVGIFLMVLLGGMGSMWGAVLGAAVYVVVPYYLSNLARYETVVYGGVLLVVIIALPDGIYGGIGRLARTVRGRLRVGGGLASEARS